MKVLFGILALAVFVLVTSFTPTAAVPAGHEQPGQYSGQTDQGHTVNLNVMPGSPNFIDNWSIGFTLTCAKTGRRPGIGHGFGGFHVDIVNHTFSFEYTGAFFFYFKWTGRFTGGDHVDGGALVTWGGVIDRNSVEKCQSGRRLWSADHVLDGTKVEGTYNKFIQVTRDSSTGKIDVTVRD